MLYIKNNCTISIIQAKSDIFLNDGWWSMSTKIKSQTSKIKNMLKNVLKTVVYGVLSYLTAAFWTTWSLERLCWKKQEHSQFLSWLECNKGMAVGGKDRHSLSSYAVLLCSLSETLSWLKICTTWYSEFGILQQCISAEIPDSSVSYLTP